MIIPAATALAVTILTRSHLATDSRQFNMKKGRNANGGRKATYSCEQKRGNAFLVIKVH